MSENPLQMFETIDPELFKAVENTWELALGEGVLPKKYKYLIALALDAADGAETGVRNLAQAAMKAGASREEIAETLRIAYFIDGVGCMYTASRGLAGVL